MSRRTIQNRKRIEQATIKMQGEGSERKKRQFRDVGEAMNLLIPNQVVKDSNGTVCTKPRRKPFNT